MIRQQERRQKLMPFFWNTIATKGMLFGNRTIGNKVDVANPHWFSYPGYNEILTGYPDTAINSNEYPPNPHTNVFAFLNQDFFDSRNCRIAVSTSSVIRDHHLPIF